MEKKEEKGGCLTLSKTSLVWLAILLLTALFAALTVLMVNIDKDNEYIITSLLPLAKEELLNQDFAESKKSNGKVSSGDDLKKPPAASNEYEAKGYDVQEIDAGNPAETPREDGKSTKDEPENLRDNAEILREEVEQLREEAEEIIIDVAHNSEDQVETFRDEVKEIKGDVEMSMSDTEKFREEAEKSRVEVEMIADEFEKQEDEAENVGDDAENVGDDAENVGDGAEIVGDGAEIVGDDAENLGDDAESSGNGNDAVEEHPASCTDGFVREGDLCYLYVDRAGTWHAAAHHCRSLDAYLAEPRTQGQIRFLKNLSAKKHREIWLGGTDLAVEGKWVWAHSGAAVDGPTDWTASQPDNYGSGEDCLEISDYKGWWEWNDVQCGESKEAFVCQKEMNREKKGQVQLQAGVPAHPADQGGYPAAPAHHPDRLPAPAHQSIYDPPVPVYVRPFTSEIPMRLSPFKTIYIQGIPNTNPSYFQLNILCGPPFQGYDIALHIAVRFNYNGDKKGLVLNSMKQGKWGKEERYFTSFPFKPDVEFEIMVLCEKGFFEVVINNEQYVRFSYRVELEKATHISVLGDTRLKQIEFNKRI